MPTLRPHRWRYTLHAYRALPVTFVRRVVFGRDPYWRQYFWSRWGWVPRRVVDGVRGRPVLWLDALSGGEVTQIVTFCRRLRDALPGWAVVLSTNNRYSFDFARANLAVDFVIDTPWDCRGPARRALRRLRPAALVAIESVTAPGLVKEAHRRGITTVLVSGLMSRDIHLHPMYRRTMEERPFDRLDWIGAKTAEDARQFDALGARAGRTVVTGNMKFDTEFLQVPSDARARLRGDLGLGPEEPVLLAASLHPGEEALVADAFAEARGAVPGLRLVLVPRYQFDVSAMIETLSHRGLASVRKTALAGCPAPATSVVVVDTFGELNRLYAVAAVVFLGGSTYRRNVLGLGQNLIEPLAQRVPIFFGPFMHLWRDIIEELKAEWPGLEVTTAAQLAEGLREALSPDSGCAERIRKKIDTILWTHRNDVANNVDLVTGVLATAGGESRPDRP